VVERNTTIVHAVKSGRRRRLRGKAPGRELSFQHRNTSQDYLAKDRASLLEKSMTRNLTVLAVWLLLVPSVSQADEPSFPDSPNGAPGGFTFIRRGDQRIVSFGGILVPMKVKVTNLTPEGPASTRMSFPSALHSPVMPPEPGTLGAVPANVPTTVVHVHLPDADGLLYVNGNLTGTRGADHQIVVPAGQSVRLRAAFKVEANLLIEDKVIQANAGQPVSITFTGERALVVPLPAPQIENGPAMRRR